MNEKGNLPKKEQDCQLFCITVHGLSNVSGVDCIVVRVLTVVIFLNHHCIKGKKTPDLIANRTHLQVQNLQQLCISHLPYSGGYQLTVQFREMITTSELT